jgi:pimeloyl-ACP methyl ester carboxylesterase
MPLTTMAHAIRRWCEPRLVAAVSEEGLDMGEHTRARLGEPRHTTRAGCRIGYQVSGTGDPVILLFSAWQIVHSAAWRAQVPALSQHARVITVDCIGSGRSDRPEETARYHPFELVADTLAVLDAENARTCLVGGFSYGGHLAALTAARHPDRVCGAMLLAPSAPFGPSNPALTTENFTARREAPAGWQKYNLHFWRSNYADFAAFFMREVFPSPRSEHLIDEGVTWAGHTDAETLIRTIIARRDTDGQDETTYRTIRCPVLVIHGTDDRIVPPAKGALVAEVTSGQFVAIPGAGHMPGLEMPDPVNDAMIGFLRTCGEPRIQA